MKSILVTIAIVIMTVFCLLLIGDVFSYGFRIMLFGMKLTLLPVAMVIMGFLGFMAARFLYIRRKSCSRK